MSFAIDSREVEAGGFFFALPGSKRDGHEFLEDAARRGAIGAVVKRGYRGPSFGLELIEVIDVKRALHELAREAMGRRKTRVIGITASAGKTSMKEYIADLLSVKFRVARTRGSRNAQASFPIEVLRSDPEAEWFVAEMGMSVPGEIAQLVAIAPPELVVMGRINFAHSMNFKDLEGIAAAKAEILWEDPDHLIVHSESFEQKAVKKFCPSSYELYPTGNSSIASPFTESHLSENFEAAVRVARYAGMSDEEIVRGSLRLKSYDHRFQKKEYEGVLYIDDSYNANPLSMEAALTNLPKPAPGGRTIVVLGSMGELGFYHREGHLRVGKEVCKRADLFLSIGEGWEESHALFQRGEHFTDYAFLKRRLQLLVRPGDVVLVKGSKFHALWKIIDFIG